MSFFKRANSTPTPSTAAGQPASTDKQATPTISTTADVIDLPTTSSNSSSSSTIAAADDSLNSPLDLIGGDGGIRLSLSRIGSTPVPKLELRLPETAESFFDDFSF
ncbi:hypothetical protein HK100_009654 [Physocladia obscura]|uniref:Uncharacterized protein n=1 Tax=Physocladia obscura TaxID=109957 RepID=A0AAD5X5X9_9FUNG|nr:hypothetical protein HK100_009654 [Physocladia obscura]